MKTLCVNFLMCLTKNIANSFIFVLVTFMATMGYTCPKLDGVYSCDGKKFKIKLISEEGKPKSYIINDGERVFPIGAGFKHIQSTITEVPYMESRYSCDARSLQEDIRGQFGESSPPIGILYLVKTYTKNNRGDLVVHEAGSIRLYATTVNSGFFIEDQKTCKKH